MSILPSVLAVRDSSEKLKKRQIGPYQLLNTLGIGEFGKVKYGRHTETDQEVAVKLIDKSQMVHANIRDKVDREIDILKQLRHPSIVKLYDVIETEKHIGLVMEYAQGGELFEHILARDFLEEHVARRFFAQLISSVNYMHQKKIVHRDLKLENLLLLDDEHILITDFGFANHCTKDLLSTCCGSPCYAAPELLLGTEYVGPAVDIWSCGVVLYAMLCGYLPFDDHHNMSLLYQDMLELPLTFPQRISQEARDLLGQMLEADPAFRCTMDNVFSHPWLVEQRAFLDKSIDLLEAETDKAWVCTLGVEASSTQDSNVVTSITSPDPSIAERSSSSNSNNSTGCSSNSSTSHASSTDNKQKQKQKHPNTAEPLVVIVEDKKETQEAAKEDEKEEIESIPSSPAQQQQHHHHHHHHHRHQPPPTPPQEYLPKVIDATKPPTPQEKPLVTVVHHEEHRMRLFSSLKKLIRRKSKKGNSNRYSFFSHSSNEPCTRVHTESLLIFRKMPDDELLSYINRVLTVLGIEGSPSGLKIDCIRPAAPHPGTIYGGAGQDTSELQTRFTVEICVGAASHGLRMVDVRRVQGEELAYEFLCNKVLDTLEMLVQVAASS